MLVRINNTGRYLNTDKIIEANVVNVAKAINKTPEQIAYEKEHGPDPNEQKTEAKWRIVFTMDCIEMDTERNPESKRYFPLDNEQQGHDILSRIKLR